MVNISTYNNGATHYALQMILIEALLSSEWSVRDSNEWSYKIEELGVNIGGHLYSNLRYADDAVLCANTTEEAQ